MKCLSLYICVLHVIDVPFKCGIYLNDNDSNVFHLIQHSVDSLLAFLKIDLALGAARPQY